MSDSLGPARPRSIAQLKRLALIWPKFVHAYKRHKTHRRWRVSDRLLARRQNRLLSLYSAAAMEMKVRMTTFSPETRGWIWHSFAVKSMFHWSAHQLHAALKVVQQRLVRHICFLSFWCFHLSLLIFHWRSYAEGTQNVVPNTFHRVYAFN